MMNLIRLYVLSKSNMIGTMQRSIEQRRTTSVINSSLIQQGGGFSFNNKLFDEYLDDKSCTKFKDQRGNIFDSINIYHSVLRKGRVASYISTNKGLFQYDADIGEATVLSYDFNDIVFMSVYNNTSDPINDVLVGFYPSQDVKGVKIYKARKITFNADGTISSIDLANVEIPSNITWMKYKNDIDHKWGGTLSGIIVGYVGISMWCLECTLNGAILNITGSKSLTLNDVTSIVDVINGNTVIITADNMNLYYVAVPRSFTESSVNYASMGQVYSHETLNNITVYDQIYATTNDISHTFALILNDEIGLLSIGYFVNSSVMGYPGDYKIYHVDTDENYGGINGGYVKNAIRHRMYTITDESGYRNGDNIYATYRHIFASSTRLMDINNNRYVGLKYFRDTDGKTNYSLLPSTNKTPIFTINTSIEIDSEKYGNVIATDYNTVKGLYYIYTDSHVGIYFITTRQLTWATRDIITRMSDIYTISDITVINGQAKEFVNGIMTTTAMNGPTFDQLYAEIDELRKRVVALEGMIRNETYMYADGGEKEECVVWGRKIGSGSGDVYNTKFTNNVATFIPEVRNSVEAVVDKENKEIEKFGAAIMEIGNVIDFHVPNTGCNNGCKTNSNDCGHEGHGGDIPITDHQKCPCYGDSTKTDYCARIYVDRNNTLIIRANGLYYQPIHNAATSSLPVTVSENGTCVKAEMAAKKNDGTSYYVRVNNS